MPLGNSQLGVAVPGLSITVTSASSFDPANTTVNASGASFGLNSPTPSGAGAFENSSRFDVDAQESLAFFFNQDIRIISVELGSFTGDEIFTLGGITFGNVDAPDDIFTFANGGLVSAANQAFTLEAGGPASSSVGLVALTIDVIPEPSTSTLLGLGGFALIMRRRK